MTEAVPAARVPGRLGWLAPAIFALAFALRALHLFQLSDAPFFPMLMGDAEGYALWARELAAGNWLGDRVFYQAPLYPYFLGALYQVVGEGPMAIKLVQALLGSGACVFLANAGMRFFSKRVGVVAGVALALYAPAIFFDGLIQKSVLDLFLLCALLDALSRLRERPGAWLFAVAGATFGALVLTRENALALLPPILIFAWLSGDEEVPPLLRTGALLAGASLLLLPVALRNLAVGGEFHLTTSQFGTNFYIGNNEAATGRYLPLRHGRGTWEHEREDAVALAEAAEGRVLTPAEVSGYWTDRALDYVASRPGDWLRLMGRKILLLSNRAELIDTEDVYTHAEWSTPLRLSLPIFHFGVLAPLALLGVLVTVQRRRELWLLYGLILFYAASVAVFYVFARYRYPLVPFLMLFAAAGVVGVRAFWKGQSWRMRFACVGLVGAAAVFCNWPIESAAGMRSATHRNVGVVLLQAGDAEAAEGELRRAVSFDAGNVLAVHSLATVRFERGDLEESEALYRRALELKPDHAPSHAKLGVVLARRRLHEQALAHQRRAIEIQPDLALAHFQLGIGLAIMGQTDAAEDAFREALRLDPAASARLARTVLGTLGQGAPTPRQAAVSLRLATLAMEGPASEEAIVVAALAEAQSASGLAGEADANWRRAALLAKGEANLSAAERAHILERASP